MPLPQKIKIEVTQEHIDKGKKKDPASCPVALALLESYKHASVGFAYTTIEEEVPWYRRWFAKDSGFRRLENSERLSFFVADFDSGEPVVPTTFVERIVDWK